MINPADLKQHLTNHDTHITTNQGTYRLLDVTTNYALIENYNTPGYRRIQAIPFTEITHYN